MDYSNLTQRLSPAWTKAQETVRPVLLLLSYPLSTSADTQTLLEPYTYISANPGKEIRSQLIEAFNLWLDVPERDLEVIRGVVRMLHNASLLYVFLSSSSRGYRRKCAVKISCPIPFSIRQTQAYSLRSFADSQDGRRGR
jgi:hypothetical protein